MTKYCCKFMEEQLTHTCDLHGDGPACPDVAIFVSKAKFSVGKLTLRAKNTEYECNFCPSCGTRWTGGEGP